MAEASEIFESVVPPVFYDQGPDGEAYLRRPTYLTRGGAQLVYDIPGSDEVLKLDYFTLSDGAINGQFGYAAGNVPDCDLVRYRNTGQLLREALVSRIFGEERVLPSRTVFGPVALSGRLCRELWGSAPFADGQVRWFRTFITRQKKARPLLEADRFQTRDLRLDIPEHFRPDVDREAYARLASRWLLMNGQPIPKRELSGVFARTGDEATWERVQALLGDGKVRSLLADFVSRAIHMGEYADEHVDLLGENNVIFYRPPEETPAYLLIDPLVSGEGGVLAEARAVLRPALYGDYLSRQGRVALLNTVGYVRWMNTLAELLELPGRLTTFQSDYLSHEAAWDNLLTCISTVKLRGHGFPTQHYQPGTTG